jgi:hypothetical protein
VSPGSLSPFGVEPGPEDFFFWELILKKFFLFDLCQFLLETCARTTKEIVEKRKVGSVFLP